MSFESNILSVYHSATEQERLDGEQWYTRAAYIAQRIAMKNNLPITTVAGVIAALSPRNRWETNVADAENVCFAFANGGTRRWITVRTFKRQLTAAWGILKTNEPLAYLGGLKTLNFYRCIIQGDSKSVCVDSHAATLAMNGLRERLIAPSINVLLYTRIADAYRTVAEQVGVLPSALQATTWLTYRNHWEIT